MNTYDLSFLGALNESHQVLMTNAAVYEEDALTKAQTVRFTDYKTSLFTFAERMDAPTEWLFIDKNEIKTELIVKLLPFSNNMVRFANSKKDTLLLKKLKISKSRILGLSEINLIVYTEEAIKIAKANLSELSVSKITEESIAALETDLKALQQKRSERLLLMNDKKVSHENFINHKKKINKFLRNELDLSVETYRNSHPDFVNHYFSARQSARNIHRPCELLGYITDADTGLPIAEGLVTAVGLGMTATISPLGAFRFKSFPTGDHSLKIETIGYKTVYLPVRHFESKPCKLNLTMVALPLQETEPVV